MNLKSLVALTVAASATPLVMAGPIAYGLCQTGCNSLLGACYAGVGFTVGVTIVGAPPAILACNAGLGTCMAACAVTCLFAPTP
ncbi:hypothetical protein PAXINDRAFT_169066 [Paxillus involutus ATCC 200175]|uniref:Cysteine-rich protein n=1 Tax=Paxillus involutus ATCC 200175 TaxID=664439 RepID=A0A0C9TJ03_PAXIN|nr:hypothetical protein PAXINDRAFT_169066 [Paxillus involutus ATCC 200175]